MRENLPAPHSSEIRRTASQSRASLNNPRHRSEEKLPSRRVGESAQAPSLSRRTSQPRIVDLSTATWSAEELRSELLRVKSRSAETEKRLRAGRDQYYQCFLEARASLAVAKEKMAKYEEKIRKLKADLAAAQEQHASIRNHLQLRDSHEPREVVAEFRALKRSISYLCTDLSASITDHIHSFSPNLQLSTQASRPRLLSKSLSKSHSLIISPTRKGRPLEDFIDYSLRFLLNAMLFQELFDRYHPHVPTDVGDTLALLYEQIQSQVPQTIAAKWRSTSFEAIERVMGLDAANTTWARGFVKRFEKEVVESLVVSICGPDRWSTKFFSPKHREEAFNVGQKAYLWHRKAQANVLALDFKPRLADSGLDFDEETMRLLKHNQATPSKNGPIIASVGLGLVSYRSLGEGKAKEQVWQEKIDVLMEECFS